MKARKQLLRLRSVEEELVRAEGKELTVLMQEIRTGMIAEKVRGFSTPAGWPGASAV